MHGDHDEWTPKILEAPDCSSRHESTSLGFRQIPRRMSSTVWLRLKEIHHGGRWRTSSIPRIFFTRHANRIESDNDFPNGIIDVLDMPGILTNIMSSWITLHYLVAFTWPDGKYSTSIPILGWIHNTLRAFPPSSLVKGSHVRGAASLKRKSDM